MSEQNKVVSYRLFVDEFGNPCVKFYRSNGSVRVYKNLTYSSNARLGELIDFVYRIMCKYNVQCVYLALEIGKHG